MFINKIKVLSNAELGRYGVAGEDIAAGELLFEETPFAYGPKQSTNCICLECYANINGGENGPRCPKCYWPLCKNCINIKDHKPECEVFAQAKVKFQSVEDATCVCPQLDCITPLRMLLKMEANPELWEKEVSVMEYHDVERRAMKDIWNADLVNIAKYLRGPCKLNRFSDDLIMQIIGILEINAFEGRTAEGYPIRFIFPKTAILAHNCVPNVVRSIYPSNGFKMQLRASVDIKKKQQINICYTFTLNGTLARQAHLKAGKFFICRCNRCQSPTELSTNFSSFKCKKCESGFLITTNPFVNSAEWKCTACNFKMAGNLIQDAINDLQSKIAVVQEMNFQARKLESVERLLQDCEKILHPSHFISISLKQNLIELYGRVPGYEMSKLSPDLLDRKQNLCKSILNILKVFEPGFSRARAMMLYELHAPLLMNIRKSYANGSLKGQKLITKVNEVIEILKECIQILANEDPISHEGVLADIAQQALLQIEQNLEQATRNDNFK